LDTDDLTKMAYQTIILANKATDILKCKLGVLCGKFSSEDEYLSGVLACLAELTEDPEEYLDSWGLLGKTDVPTFVAKLDALRRHVENTLKTPYMERGRPAF
jgi:hypothetical protein